MSKRISQDKKDKVLGLRGNPYKYIAELTGVPRSTISRIMTGHKYSNPAAYGWRRLDKLKGPKEGSC